MNDRPPRTLVIACGALAREFLAVRDANGWTHLDITCLPAEWHNRPEKIPDGVRRKIRAGRRTHDEILVFYGDCGTGGLLDAVLAEEGVERIEGAHCYAFFMGLDRFDTEHDRELGTLYLTDYFVRHFDRLIMKGLGLDRRPELRDAYFGHYTRCLYMAQMPTEQLERKARACAEKIGLRYEFMPTGLREVERWLDPAARPSTTAPRGTDKRPSL